ncbi:flagellar basal-body MS-ring/collar protein FliF [Parafrigoribacterium mesophilum]|uniref:flagellar basal-body MS-ring/collar protein FliF n=1 Tax=Parafrigoribacterium mesophilum TaxID=433646 RepID=UPI0031FCCD67
MVRQITSAFGRFAGTIGKFSIAQRTIAVIGIAVLVLGITAFATWALKPSYSPLFSGLAAADASAIVEQLRTDGVPYQITEGGGTILVPEDKVYDERMKSAAAGIPASTTGGYSLLDKMGVTSSEFQQSVTYKRAMEGELASTIASLDGVKAASVHLAIPEKTVFVSKVADPTASVFIDTKNGVTLSREQVQAIVHLTSASVEGMAPTDVAVIDAKGNVLSVVGGDAADAASAGATDYEERVRTAVQTMLDRVVGSGNATVVVAADMDQESAVRTEESFTTPEGAPALNEATSKQSVQGSAGSATGVLGPDNIAVPAPTGDAGGTASESVTKNNAVNKVTESRTIPAGSVKRQTVSVAVNAAVAKNLDVPAITALVSSAAGISTERGDQVAVKVVNFDNSRAAEAAAALNASKEAAASEAQSNLLRTGIMAGGAVLIFILGLIAYARFSKRQKREAIDLAELVEAREVLEAPMRPAGLPPRLAPAEMEPPAGISAAEPDPNASGPSELDRTRADIDLLAGNDPEKMADFLRGLMDDRQPV